MNLDTAHKIIEEQIKYVSSITMSEYNLENLFDDYIGDYKINGDSIREYCIVSSYNYKVHKFDDSKIHVTQIDRFGGEGEGDQYWYVFKISHPEHGEALLKYHGYYDSWNGTSWHDDPYFVESYEYTSIGYRQIKDTQ